MAAISIGRLKNLKGGASTQAAAAMAAAFGLTTQSKDYLILRCRLILPAEILKQPDFKCAIGQPLTIKGVEWQLWERMNLEGIGEPLKDQQGRNRVDINGKPIFKEIVCAPEGTPAAGHHTIEFHRGQTNAAAIPSIEEDAASIVTQ